MTPHASKRDKDEFEIKEVWKAEECNICPVITYEVEITG